MADIKKTAEVLRTPCFLTDDSIENVYHDMLEKGDALETGVVERHGTLGMMKSLYLRDPDGNLIEISHYIE